MGAFDAFLKIDGIPGESTAKGFEKQIDIMAFSFGVSQPTAVGYGGGSGAGKAVPSDFMVTKKMDASSTPVYGSVCTGKHFPSVLLTCRRAGGTPIDFLTIKFTDVMFTNYSCSGADGGDPVPTESIAFSYSKVEVTYKQQDEKGGVAASIASGFDFKANAKV